MFQLFVSLNFEDYGLRLMKTLISVYSGRKVLLRQRQEQKKKVFDALMLETKKYDRVHHSMVGAPPARLTAAVQLCRGPDGLRLG